MAIPNVNAITAQLRMMPDRELQQYAAMHKNDPYILPMAIAESNARKEVRAQEQAKMAGQPQQKVADQAIASMGASTALPEEQGIGALPAQNMQRMADGGIAGYADGGQFNYSGGSDGPLMNMAGGGEPVVRMAGGGIARFAGQGLVGGDIAARYQQESMEMGEGRRMQYSPEVRAFAQAQEAASKAGYAERERQRMLQGPYGPTTPTPPATQPTAPQPVGQTPSPRDDSFRRQTDPRMLGVSATPPAVAAPPADTTRQTGYEDTAAPRASAAPAAPEKSAAQRFLDMQKDMGAGDRTAIDAKQKSLEESMTTAAKERQANLEKEIAERGEYGKGKESRLDKREAALAEDEKKLTGLAALDMALSLISTPGPFMNALGASGQKGLKTYSEGIGKLKLAKEKIDDSRDQLEEFRRTEANMTAKERREAANDINRTQIEVQKLGIDGLEKAYGYSRDDAKTAFAAATQEGLTKMEIKSKENIAAMQERGNMARAAMPSGEMRTAMMLGTGATDAAKLESGMKKLQEITADKSGMAAVKLLAETNAGRAKNGEPPITMQDLLGSAREYSALMYPKIADIPNTKMLAR